LFGTADGSAVMHAAGPGLLAQHGPGFFQRDLAHTQREGERLHQIDGSQWVGEWHTHIGVPPIPSEVDLNTYVGHVLDEELGFERFVALIVGTSGPKLLLSAWLLERQRDNVVLVHAGDQLLD
jgi:proteasome lid subunit RPN8/RPN11